ncbi:MAG: hypothetical protein ABSH56_29150 [Bryobacteraceae bacterium]
MKTTLLTALLCVAPAVMQAQFDFTLDGRNVQVHSFASQGFALSNVNNYLTMDTSNGSFAMTNFGANVSTQITDKFRVGAQLYDYNLGLLGGYHPELDWAYADYKFKDWFGIRGGKVKTVQGLSHDVQDMEFINTWALMPQSVYPLDTRGDTIAHIGADIYGAVSLKRLNSFSYTVYGGERPNDPYGGYLYGVDTMSHVPAPQGGFMYITGQTKHVTYYGGPVYGADLRWSTPVKGLLLGASYMVQNITTTGNYTEPVVVPYKLTTVTDKSPQFYVEYVLGSLRFAGEYRSEPKIVQLNEPNGVLVQGSQDSRSGYVSLSYRFTKWLELGAYQSRYIDNWTTIHSDPRNHIFDQTIAARFDISRFVDLKVEEHFIDGAAVDGVLDHGFYAAPNPNGLAPSMHMLVATIGYHM